MPPERAQCRRVAAANPGRRRSRPCPRRRDRAAAADGRGGQPGLRPRRPRPWRRGRARRRRRRDRRRRIRRGRVPPRHRPRSGGHDAPRPGGRCDRRQDGVSTFQRARTLSAPSGSRLPSSVTPRSSPPFRRANGRAAGESSPSTRSSRRRRSSTARSTSRWPRAQRSRPPSWRPTRRSDPGAAQCSTTAIPSPTLWRRPPSAPTTSATAKRLPSAWCSLLPCSPAGWGGSATSGVEEHRRVIEGLRALPDLPAHAEPEVLLGFMAARQEVARRVRARRSERGGAGVGRGRRRRARYPGDDARATAVGAGPCWCCSSPGRTLGILGEREPARLTEPTASTTTWRGLHGWPRPGASSSSTSRRTMRAS